MHVTVSQDQSQSVFKNTSYTQTSHTHPQEFGHAHIRKYCIFITEHIIIKDSN